MAIQINKTQLLEILVAINKPTLINLKTETSPKIRANDIFTDGLKKLSSCNFIVLKNYKDRINNNRKKENKVADFVPQPMKGREHISECVCTDTATRSKFYLVVERFDEIKPKVTYFYNNNVIDKNIVKPLLYASSPKNQGLERPINILTYGLDSIKEITLNKKRYVII